MNCIQMNCIKIHCTPVNCIQVKCIQSNCIQINCIQKNYILITCFQTNQSDSQHEFWISGLEKWTSQLLNDLQTTKGQDEMFEEGGVSRDTLAPRDTLVPRDERPASSTDGKMQCCINYSLLERKPTLV